MVTFSSVPVTCVPHVLHYAHSPRPLLPHFTYKILTFVCSVTPCIYGAFFVALDSQIAFSKSKSDGRFVTKPDICCVGNRTNPNRLNLNAHQISTNFHTPGVFPSRRSHVSRPRVILWLRFWRAQKLETVPTPRGEQLTPRTQTD